MVLKSSPSPDSIVLHGNSQNIYFPPEIRNSSLKAIVPISFPGKCIALISPDRRILVPISRLSEYFDGFTRDARAFRYVMGVPEP